MWVLFLGWGTAIVNALVGRDEGKARILKSPLSMVTDV